MADTSFAVTAGSGTNLHTVTTSIGGSTVHDQVIKQGEAYLATYTISSSMSTATAASHLLQVMAGSTLNVYIRRIVITQYLVAATAAMARLQIYRLTTAGTGGGSVTPSPLDTTDSASGATAMTLPTAKGTEGAELWRTGAAFIQTVGAGTFPGATILADWDFERMRTKGIRIPAGTANGIAVKNVDAVASGGVNVTVLLSEANF